MKGVKVPKDAKKLENINSFLTIEHNIKHIGDELHTFVNLYKKQKKTKNTEKRERDVELMRYNTVDKKQKSRCEHHLSDVLNSGGEILGINTVGSDIIYTLVNYIDDE